MKSINPKTGEQIEIHPVDSIASVYDTIADLSKFQLSWKNCTIDKRRIFLESLIDQLEVQKEELVSVIEKEMGKIRLEAHSEIEKCLSLCRYYCNNFEDFLKPEYIKTSYSNSYVSYEPLGVILAIMPWNFPFWQVFRCMIPAIIAGNVVLLKHASNVTGCAKAIESIVSKACDMGPLIGLAILPSAKMESIIAHTAIRSINFTGSVDAGRKVGALAGKYLKKSVLELGGNDPYIIDENVDIELALKKTIQSRILNMGQSCIGAKRIIVLKGIHDEFLNALIKKLNYIQESGGLAPLAREDLRLEVHEQVLKARDQGAKLEIGGYIPKGPGFHYPITVLSEVNSKMSMFNTEIFGPVFTIISASSWSNALELANHSDFGLGAAIFTKDIDKAEHTARFDIQAGAVTINDFVKSDPRLPFGGVKDSGYGRELSKHGLLEFTNIKTISVS